MMFLYILDKEQQIRDGMAGSMALWTWVVNSRGVTEIYEEEGRKPVGDEGYSKELCFFFRFTVALTALLWGSRLFSILVCEGHPSPRESWWFGACMKTGQVALPAVTRPQKLSA
jgi:hypothetical protein